MKPVFGAAVLAAAFAATPLAAQESGKDFFDGKTVSYIVATNPGGGYDYYARLLAKHMEKYLPGAKIVVRNMPGAGHIVGANYIYAAKPDGLTIGTFNTGLIYSQILGSQGVQFDLGKMSWIGKAANDPYVLIAGSDTDIETIEDIRNLGRPMKLASSGIGATDYNHAKLFGRAMDLEFDLVTGFGGNEGEMSIMRGELDGTTGSFSSLQPFVEAGNARYIFGVGDGLPEGVPQARDHVVDEAGAKVIAVIDSLGSLSRFTAGPPGVPEDRLQALRDAYDQAIHDPELIAEAEAAQRPIDYGSGQQVEQMIQEALNQTPETVNIFAEVFDAEIPTVTVNVPLESVSDDKKTITFKSGEEEVSASVSGSRTAIRIAGQDASRDALQAGMECEVEYNPAHETNEAARIACAQ
jgi:tripartite-type tricarboxylate transporter receptor subunit TctC